MPVIEKWGRGKPSKEKIEQTAQHIRDGWTLPEGMKIPASVQALLNPVAETRLPDNWNDRIPIAPAIPHDDGVKPRRTAKRIAHEERTAHVVRVRTSDEYAPITKPTTILSITKNYRDMQKWFAEDKVGEGALETAEKHYLRIPEELRNNG